eukprot:2078565-Pyramimonas_sp.AAC.1
MTAGAICRPQDRSDIQFPVKELAKSGETHGRTLEDEIDLRKPVKTHDGSGYLYKCEHKPGALTAWADTDHAGCKRMRQSKSGGNNAVGTSLDLIFGARHRLSWQCRPGRQSIMG